MNSKTIFLATIMICIYSLGFCQNLNTFNGKYDDGTVNKGFATYTYYIDKNTQEYIKHGLFKFKYSDKNDISSQKVSISGNYKNNKREGVWSFTIALNDWPTNGDAFITGTKTLTANYSNGYPNGAWVYKYQYKKREKRYTLGGFVWTPFTPATPELVTANFSNGTIIGSVKFENNPPFSEYSTISGQFDNFGRMVGTWLYKSSDKEKTVEFKNGIVVSFIVRETGSGRITSKDIDNAEMTQIKNDFIAGKIKISELTKLKIKIDTIDAVKNNDYDFTQSFNLSDFRCEYIPGDESYYYRPSIYNDVTHEYTQESGWVETRNNGKFYIFTKTPTYKLSDLKEFNSAIEHLSNEDYREAQNLFENIAYQYKENIEDKDLALIQSKIAECEKGNDKNRRISKARRLYESIDQSLKWNLEKSALENLDTLLNKYSDVFNPEEIADIQKKHDKIFNKFKEQEIDAQEWSQIRKNKESISSLHLKLIELYKATGDNYSGYSTFKKSRLFGFYNDIYMDYSKQLNNGGNRKNQLEISSQLVAVQNKMILLFDSDSKNIEKQLKKAETIIDKVNILK